MRRGGDRQFQEGAQRQRRRGGRPRDGDEHEPGPLGLNWGNELKAFRARLTSLDITYTLFDPEGAPLRATLSLDFVEALTPKEVEIESQLELMSVHAQAKTERIPECRLVFADGSLAGQEFPLTDSDTFKAGAEVSIAASFGSSTPQGLVEGVLVAMRMRLGGREPRLEVACRSQAV